MSRTGNNSGTKVLRRIKLTIEFDGKPYTGWQRQNQGTSVQEEIERALEKLLQHRVTLNGAGRTDAGVHARGMVAHFDTSNPLPARKLPVALPAYLPKTISILSADEVAPDFDARRDAVLRWYRYQMMLSRTHHPLGPHAWYFYKKLDVDRMMEAVKVLRGKHDFSGFRAAACTAERTLLTMKEASLTRHGTGGELLVFDFKCQSFLQRMVRLLVGSVVGVGLGRFTLDDLIKIRDTGKRPSTILSVPAQGLCLMRIAYSREEAENILTDHPPAPSF
ncbi:tRNA pseudouridine(38-40) synthase TruA [Candidatus Sumerlaeota bacterium]|nr:tRNA pseudouridine(38-40) synthase TruA [Candidatus Sumerlaeota bacterium]